ncbi:hypothetical protein LTR37_019965 [Vermiconidia calcicola]|uniref:Uncharacterized protein n=1 Tax=Vermiconidia calcicola TaxID=1690605 RepID=A0ACC3MCW8_9PEZI|nr:hypothetical protein LTR37_019965 [Vermiconidia calcicola]
MRVPNFAGLKNATETTDSSAATGLVATEAIERIQREHRFGRPTAVLHLTDSEPRSVPAEKDEAQGIQERAPSCGAGKSFYRCANGFTGCCSVDPCLPGETCPDGKRESTTEEKTETATQARTTTTQLSDRTAGSEQDGRTSISFPHREPLLTATRTGDSTSSSSSRPSPDANLPPECPDGNGRTGTSFTDSSGVEYIVYCNRDNTQSTFDTTTVGVGGYAECFSACSKSKDCAGFTFIGRDTGSCLLKSAMPSVFYQRRLGRSYVSCEKVDPNAVAPGATSTSTPKDSDSSKKAPVGIIVGAVLGSLAFLALLVVLIAFFAKRHRKKIERRRATITQVISGPIEVQETTPTGGHHRQGSSSHDVFQPFGGFYRGWTKSQSYEMTEDGRLSEYRPKSYRPEPEAPGMRAEANLTTLPATVYQVPRKPVPQRVTALEDSPTERPGSQASSDRASRFREHLGELGDNKSQSSADRNASPSIDSPTLGRQAYAPPNAPLADEVRRRQHLGS